MELTKQACTEIFKYYNLGNPQAVQPLTKGYANANYKITTQKGSFLFKIHLLKGQMPMMQMNILSMVTILMP